MRMKLYAGLSLLIALIIGAACTNQNRAKNEYRIHGKVASLKDGATVYLTIGNSYLYYTYPIDSARVVNGEFEFHNTTAQPGMAILEVNGDQYLYQPVIIAPDTDIEVMEKKPSEVIMPEEGRVYISVKGHEAQAQMARYEYLSQIIDAKHWVLNAAHISAMKDPSLKGEFEKLEKEVKDYQQQANQALLADPSSPAIWVLLDNYFQEAQMLERPVKEVNNLIASLHGDAAKYEFLPFINDGLKQISNISVGSPVMDFELYDKEKKPIRLSDYKGKKIILVFSSSFCGPCKMLNKEMESFVNSVPQDNFEIITVYDDKGDIPQKMIDERNAYPWVILSNVNAEGKRDDQIQRDYCINAFPTIFLIDENFKIAENQASFDDISQKISGGAGIYQAGGVPMPPSPPDGGEDPYVKFFLTRALEAKEALKKHGL